MRAPRPVTVDQKERTMIKKISMTLAVLLMCMTQAVSAELKVAFLNPEIAILGTEEAKMLGEAANKELETEQNELRTLREKIEAQQKKMQTDGEILSDAEKRKMAADVEEMTADFQFNGQKLQKRAQDMRTEIIAQLEPKYRAVVDEIVQIDQLDVIMAPGTAIYVNPKHDITRRVTEKMNEQAQ
ncbi:MAG TPA: hypothetical protein DER02_07010 [Gammaproteobacteria bacterium]|jgi:outer membrane protein|nr:hypothetical protein [Gammaproteobacteria bacterium]|tara:strand:+ start:93 stop:647 length:555 start_codon:yes stop_codon:yes gene_type:complete